MKSGLNLVELAKEIERRANAKVDLVAKTEALTFTATGDEKDAVFGIVAGQHDFGIRERLVLCESPDGWSLHAPGSTDDDIASGDAPYLAAGPWDDDQFDEHARPNEADYAAALACLDLARDRAEEMLIELGAEYGGVENLSCPPLLRFKYIRAAIIKLTGAAL